MKRQSICLLFGFVALLIAAATADGHEMTERYIPVGAYPTLRGPDTMIGTIAAADVSAGAVTIAADRVTRRYRITKDTRIWLDRSLLKKPTADGSLADCKAGMKAEIKGAGPEKPDEARWVKVQIPN